MRLLLRTEAGREALGTVENGLQQLNPLNEQYLELGSRKQFAEAHQFMNAKILPVVESMELAGDALTKQQRTFLTESQRDADAGIVRARWMTLGAIGASFLVGALVLFGIRGITSSLRKVAEELSLGAQQTASAAAQVAAASQSMAQGSSEQAASLEETSASSEEIHSVAKRNADSSRSAAGLMSSSQERFRKASEALGQTVGAMNEINVQSEKISKIIQVIDGIAFQTNILALNAAVEAARAGQAGLGFAVVADEVRNLAQRCAQAARDTSELIEESMAKSRDGKSKVDGVSAALQGVAEESTRVKIMVDEVSVGSEEQARGLDEIRRAITQMEQVTQASAATAEESAAAAEELNAQTETVKSVAMQLTAMVGAA
ncbi:MAG: methyl-accepting chemotaxis protein [Bryobacteraceae bacterium]